MSQCSNCGAELRPGANFCSECGASAAESARAAETAGAANESLDGGGLIAGVPPAPALPPPDAGKPLSPRKIETHLIKSIIAVICCCMPLGVVGIIYSAKADALLRQGDIAGAEDAGRKADLWGNLAIGVGLTVNILMTVLMLYRFKEGTVPGMW